MSLQYEKYKFSRTSLSDSEFNKRWQDLDLRLHGLENDVAAFDGAVDALVAKGLSELNAQVAASVDLLNDSVAAANLLLDDAEARLDVLEAQFTAIIEGGSLPAASITVSTITNLTATDAQAAFAEHQSDIDTIEGDITTLQGDLASLTGVTVVVADNTARDALTGLGVGDLVHVLDNGSAMYQRWQITAITDGAWSTSTKVSIQIEGAVAAHTHPMSEIVGLVTALSGKAETGHTHTIANVSGLQTALDAKVPTTRTVSAGGIATGGGDLSANRTITVTKAAGSDLRTGTNDTNALTPKAAFDAAAIVTLTDATTISSDFAAGFNFQVTLQGNRTLGSPSNAKPGQSGFIRIVQDGVGFRTLAYNSVFKFAGGTDPVLSTAANSIDVLFFTVYSSSVIYATLLKDMK